MAPRRQNRLGFGFALSGGSCLLLLTAICAAFLAAEPPAGKHAFRQYETNATKAKVLLHRLSTVSMEKESASQIRSLLEDLLAVDAIQAPVRQVELILKSTRTSIRISRLPAFPLFQRPPPPSSVS